MRVRRRARSPLRSLRAALAWANDGTGAGAEPETRGSRLGTSMLPTWGTLMKSQVSTPFVPCPPVSAQVRGSIRVNVPIRIPNPWILTRM
ncbi:hypothetical protein GCM10023198_46840 [Promicromonospora umidemergens]|uniref:Secreted protein n=1 Tax=Promicromonospora umidemergens TaxID=629679 RepID=A0ABP8XY72_9MICO